VTFAATSNIVVNCHLDSWQKHSQEVQLIANQLLLLELFKEIFLGIILYYSLIFLSKKGKRKNG
jgi:hypothetical protein